MLRFLGVFIIQALAIACQSTQLPAKNLLRPSFDKAPRVDEGVRANQSLWLKGMVLDPDQTGLTTLVVLGDSYSDTGNLFQRTQLLGPPEIFWRSRFSNGPIWVDYVQGATGWKVRNYAFVDVDEEAGHDSIPKTSLKSQVERLKQETRNLNRDEMLISLWVGPDAYREATGPQSVPAVLQEIERALIALDELGFHQVAVGNMPDLAQLPLASSNKLTPPQRDFWRKAAALHNAGLGRLLQKLARDYPDMRAYVYQAYEIQQVSREKARAAHVVLKAEACYNGDARGEFEGEARFCRQPGSTQYWDAMHPSSKLHCFYAAQFLADSAYAEHVGGYNLGHAVDHCQRL